MKLPRDLSGEDLAKALERLGYLVTRQTSDFARSLSRVTSPATSYRTR
jgi:hypothetical protein